MSRDPETFAIIGAAMEVHRHLGAGFLEAVYHEALTLELTDRGIPFQTEVPFSIRYDRRWLTTSYRADLVCCDSIIVELKALHAVGGREYAQVLNYLKASGLHRGLLLNFGAPSLEYRRFVFSDTRLPDGDDQSRKLRTSTCAASTTRGPSNVTIETAESVVRS